MPAFLAGALFGAGARQVCGRRSYGETKMAASHVPVMVQEVLDFLSPVSGAVFLDTTLGGGGHSLSILEAIQPSGVLIGCDRDGDAVEFSRERLAPYGPAVRIHHAPYSEIKRIVSAEGFESVDGVLFDLGLSSIQLETPGRGFRLDVSEPLDMRMDPRSGKTAADLVNFLSEKKLADIIYHYGEERKSRAIARAIVRAREKKPLSRCDELADVVVSAVLKLRGGRRKWRIHPATRTFQALRIAVNDELATLDGALRDAVDLLRPGGRIAVISFHSLEDRIVKNVFRDLATGNGKSARIRLVNRKIVRPTEKEVSLNPRSRSARLRAAEKLEKQEDL